MESRPTLVQVPPSSILPAPGRVHPSRWRSFRAFPLIGQVAIWFAVVLSALVGVGIVGAIAAGPKPGPPAVAAVEGSAAPTTTAPAATTTTTVAATTVVATTAPTTLVAPTVAAAIPLTATVVDGDTITMSDGTTVRLIGIDTPRRGQCGYEDSSATIAQLIGGQYVTLVPGARDDIDRYGRLLRYVEVNGVDVDLTMIESGHAIARYDGRDGYGVHPRQDEYVHADALTEFAIELAIDSLMHRSDEEDVPADADEYGGDLMGSVTLIAEDDEAYFSTGEVWDAERGIL